MIAQLRRFPDRLVDDRVKGDDAADQLPSYSQRVLEMVPQQLRSDSEHDQPTRWITDPIGLHHVCTAAIERLIALSADTRL